MAMDIAEELLKGNRLALSRAITAIENEYRMFKGIPQRKSYGDWPVPQFYPQQNEGDNSNEKKNK